MRSLIIRLVRKILETKWKYRLNKSDVRVKGGGSVTFDENVIIKDSFIYVDSNSKLILKQNVRLVGISLFLTNGAVVEIGECSFIEANRNPVRPEYIIDSGRLLVGNHTKLACQRLWVRFGGDCRIGEYSNVNDGTEIRCDEKVNIGSFNQISYNIRIWDTNTHNVYSPEVRKKMTIDYFPSFGREFECPMTKPVIIGDGCWLGERVSILKGTTLGENVTVAFNTTVSNKHVPAGKKVISKNELTII